MSKMVPRHEEVRCVGGTYDYAETPFVIDADAAKLERVVQAAKVRRDLDYDVVDLCDCGDDDCPEWKIRQAICAFDAALKEIDK